MSLKSSNTKNNHKNEFLKWISVPWMFSLAFSFSFLSRHWFWRSSIFCGSPAVFLSYWRPHQKPFWKAYFFPRAPRLQWDCTPPIDDEGSGNPLHVTWVLSPVFDYSVSSIDGCQWCCICWSWIGELYQDPCNLTPRQHHIQCSVHHSMRTSQGFLSLWQWGFEAPSSLNIPFALELSQASSLWSRVLHGGGPQCSDTSGWCGRGTPSHRNWQRKLVGHWCPPRGP